MMSCRIYWRGVTEESMFQSRGSNAQSVRRNEREGGGDRQPSENGSPQTQNGNNEKTPGRSNEESAVEKIDVSSLFFAMLHFSLGSVLYGFFFGLPFTTSLSSFATDSSYLVH